MLMLILKPKTIRQLDLFDDHDPPILTRKRTDGLESVPSESSEQPASHHDDECPEIGGRQLDLFGTMHDADTRRRDE